jgi:AcrR family transcriptional regulator
MGARIIPLREAYRVRERILEALADVLALGGPDRVTSAAVAARAGLDEALIRRTFGGLARLQTTFAQSEAFWPGVDELAGGDVYGLQGRSLGEVLSRFFRGYLRAMVARPWTLAVMAAEARGERGLLVGALAYVRERRALEFFEAALEGDPPPGLDLSAVILLMATAINAVGIRSLHERSLGGIALDSAAGWRRLEDALDLLLMGALDGALSCPQRPGGATPGKNEKKC